MLALIISLKHPTSLGPCCELRYASPRTTDSKYSLVNIIFLLFLLLFSSTMKETNSRSDIVQLQCMYTHMICKEHSIKKQIIQKHQGHINFRHHIPSIGPKNNQHFTEYPVKNREMGLGFGVGESIEGEQKESLHGSG